MRTIKISQYSITCFFSSICNYIVYIWNQYFASVSYTHLYKNNTQTAITETIRICKDKNILKEYLENHEKEVIDIMVTLYSQEEVLREDVYKRQAYYRYQLK